MPHRKKQCRIKNFGAAQKKSSAAQRNSSAAQLFCLNESTSSHAAPEKVGRDQKFLVPHYSFVSTSGPCGHAALKKAVPHRNEAVSHYFLLRRAHKESCRTAER
jgi:hypothetical protein